MDGLPPGAPLHGIFLVYYFLIGLRAKPAL